MSDLIERQDALDAVNDCGICIQKILDIPSAEPERKKGKWVGDCCSCCGVSKYNYIKMVDDECGPFGTWNFCPNCGAEMSRGEE